MTIKVNVYDLVQDGTGAKWFCDSPACGSSYVQFDVDGYLRCNSCLARPKYPAGGFVLVEKDEASMEAFSIDDSEWL